MISVSNEACTCALEYTLIRTHIHFYWSIGNCPKYVTTRELSYPTQESSRSGSTCFDLDDDHILSEVHQSIIRRADCVFISSRHIDESLPDQTSGMDCNHRGGNPGFVHLDGRTIAFPDYSGNRVSVYAFFSTLAQTSQEFINKSCSSSTL